LFTAACSKISSLKNLQSNKEFSFNFNDKKIIATIFMVNNNTITVEIDNKLKKYNLLKNVPVYLESENIGKECLQTGQLVKLTLNSKNSITKIEILNNKSEKEVIQIELKKVTNPSQKIMSIVESIKSKPTVKLIDENGVYYIIATRGMTRTGGYIVIIQKAQIIKTSKDAILEVEVKYVDPSPDAIVTQAITYPYDIKSFTYDGKITQISVKTDKNINVSVDIDLASDVK
jgi:hypothetical protein